ncbi:transglycosylase domain-containing protein [Candidatus Dojkabacteria bacterium]|nr:transglycosylase domain-containing protein [Candidatus Dojkabacteria bacterium]
MRTNQNNRYGLNKKPLHTMHINSGNFVKHKTVSKYAKQVNKKSHKPRSAFKETARKILYILFGFFFFVFIVGVIGLGIYLKQLENSLPDPNKLIDRSTNLSTQIFDRKGTLLYTFYGDENREFVKIEDIPEQTKMAVLAAEDITFYQHKGLDVAAVIRAGLQYFHIISGSSGGSTISQELVRNTLLKDAFGEQAYTRTITRKVKEMLLTMQLEQTLTKDQILQLYMNEIFMGGVNFGFQSASKAYFGKNVKDLTLAESAILAGIIQAPGAYNPMSGTQPEMLRVREEYVLDQMLKHSSITGVTKEQVDEAKAQTLVYKSINTNILAPHFVFYVKQQLDDMFGPDKVTSGGLKVTTSLDYSMQKIAQEEVKKGIAAHGLQWGVRNGAAVAINPKNGDILAMVGSIDYNSKNPKIDGNVNVTLASRQMGSSVKPYTYLTAFSQGYGPWLLTPDIKNFTFGTYKVNNSDDRNRGLMVARQALLESRNVPAVYTMQLIGVENFLKTAQTLGITTLTDTKNYGLSLTLGAGGMTLLEHTAAYTVFANGGIKRDVRSILSVKDSNANILYTAPENKGTRVWDEKQVYMLNWVLCDLGGFGDQPMNSLYSLNGKRAFCGKTGTTDGPKDLTAMMYTKSLVVGFWSGNNDNTPTPGAWSTTVPLYMASAFMQRMAGKYKVESFIRPSGISAGSVCNDTGLAASKSTSCKKVPTIYLTDHAPAKDTREAAYICKSNGKVATNESFARIYNLGTTKYVLNKVMENTLQQNNYDKYMKTMKGSIYLTALPESAECPIPVGPDLTPVVAIYHPVDNETVFPGQQITITAYASAASAITRVDFMYDEVVKHTVTTGSSPYSYDYTIPGDSVAGSNHSITVIVTDASSKTASKTITVKIAASPLSVVINAPSVDGMTLPSIPYTLMATAPEVDSLSFVVTGSGGYTQTIPGSKPVSTWTGILNGIVAGNYKVVAVGKKGATTVYSSEVNFVVAP